MAAEEKFEYGTEKFLRATHQKLSLPKTDKLQ